MGKQRNVPTSIDKHEQRNEIEAALAAGTPLQRIADRYGMSAATLCRHRQRMRQEQPELFEALVAKKWRVLPEEMNELRTEMSDGFLKKLYWRDAFLTNQELRAYEAENYGAGAQISGRVHKNLELIGQAVKQIGSDNIRIQQNILVMPEFHAYRAAIDRGLRHFPEARVAVLQELQALADTVPNSGALDHRIEAA